MKRSLLLLLAAALSLAGHSQVTGDSATARLRAYFTALSSLRHFNGNVLVASGSRVLLRQSFNMEPGRDSLTVNLKSRFIIASVSKVFVKFALLRLEEKGLLKRSDRLERFIPGFPNGNRITVQQLMDHRSGLPRELAGYEQYDTLSLPQVVQLATKEKLLFEPGTQMLYSNIGFSLLHVIIGKTAPGGYAKFTRNLLRSLGLRETGEYNDATNIPNFAWGFDNRNGVVVPAPRQSISRFETGNYYSTIDDLYAFSRQLTGGSLVSETQAHSLFAGDSLLLQAGGRPGYRSYFYKNLHTGITFLFTCNYTDIPIQEMTADIINLLAGRPYTLPAPIDRKEIPLPDSVLDRYTGVYVLEADEKQSFRIARKEGALWVRDGDGSEVRIKADGETSFFEDPHSKDGYQFVWNAATGSFELTITSTGIRLKTKKLK